MPKFRIIKITPFDNGSGDIKYEVWGLTDDDPPVQIPSKHSDVRCPYIEVQVILDAPVNQKLEELKNMLIRNHADFSEDAMNEAIANDANAKIVADAFDELIDSFSGYPYDFDL